MIRTALLIFFLSFFAGCGGEGINVFSVADDVDMGRQFSDEIKSHPAEFPILKVSDYPEAYQHLKNIAASILSSEHIINKEIFEWQVSIIDNDTVLNAFCTPGGFIYVYTGLIKFLDSEDQLAGVLGHEIAHADLRHSTKQLTENYGIHVISRLLFGNNSLLGTVAGNLAGLKFSRNDETEADLQSVIYLNDTEYDPRGVAHFFEKMESNGRSTQTLVFLSTHPNPQNRIAGINRQWKASGSHHGKRFKKEYEIFKASLP